MRCCLFVRVASAACCVCCVAVSAQALNINLQFTPGTLFYPGIDGTAKATITAAATDVEEAITSSLQGFSQDVFIGNYLDTTVTFDWLYGYTNPSTGLSTEINSPAIGNDNVTIFVGTRNLSGMDLGVGGPAGLGFSASGSGFPEQSPLAINSAVEQSQATFGRGAGPVIGIVSGDFDFLGTVTPYAVDYGITYGALTFDVDEDNNGSGDSAASLDGYWHWNHNTPVADPLPGEPKLNDLYSVAVHEILHVLGIGASQSWDDLANGTSWDGEHVRAITGSGANLVNSGGNHIAFGLMSQRLSDGALQEVVMDPNLTRGQRKELTVLDLAFLRDIGYETITQPADFDGDYDVDRFDLAVIKNALGTGSGGDTDGDADTDGADLLAWQRHFSGANSVPAFTSVPEPGSAALLLLGMAMFRRRR